MSNTPKTDEIVRRLSDNGWCSAALSGFARELERENAALTEQRDELLEALENVLRRYTDLINSGDAGNWDPEEEDEVKSARAAIAKVKSCKL